METADVFTKLDLTLGPDPSRTVIRPFSFASPKEFAEDRPARIQELIKRFLRLDDSVRCRMYAYISGPMRERHRNADAIFERRLEEMREELGDLSSLSDRDKLLVGAYVSQEYAFESAALFNPSVIRVPGQAPPEDGSVRFLLSLRGIGEGHISSVTFRTGNWDGGMNLTVDPASPHGVPPRIESHVSGWVRLICDDAQDVTETVIFPILREQRQGVEDLRLVIFTEDDGSELVIGTYTAYDGRRVRQEILRGVDLRTFEMRPLSGAMAPYKGMALFPRRINGNYAMLGRQDGENIWLLYSDDLHVWETGEPIMRPCYPWEFVQIGNCGSPIEIDEGWLVFTHGVGLVRGYAIGACLLDKEDPSIVLARTRAPLVFPSRECVGGYVPNVTYSCGALVHAQEDRRRVLLPYGIGDQYTGFAVANLDDVLSVMVPC